jgi:hypothetical protein
MDLCQADPNGESDHIIGAESIQYGLDELSKHKRVTYLHAEFPHFWPMIERLHGGKTEYDVASLRALFGETSDGLIADLVSIGLFHKSGHGNSATYKVPFLYREGLALTQGRSNGLGKRHAQPT